MRGVSYSFCLQCLFTAPLEGGRHDFGVQEWLFGAEGSSEIMSTGALSDITGICSSVLRALIQSCRSCLTPAIEETQKLKA